MKTQHWLFITFLLIFSSCAEKKDTSNQEQIVAQYHEAYNNYDLNKAVTYISDSIVLSEFEFIQSTDKASWLTQSQWDLTFSPRYNILEITSKDGSVQASISKTCRRIEFLHDTAIISKTLFEFREDKISKIHVFDFVKFDFEKWQPRRDSLVKWIDQNHPELSGFIYDQTPAGGQHYLQAIEYYNASNKSWLNSAYD